MRGLILIIDDNPVDVKLVTKSLESKGFACQGFTDHNEAIRWLDSNSPQLIFLDLQMPAVTGYDLIPVLKKMANASMVPIVIISGKNRTEDITKAIKLGANDYIIKPLDPMIIQEKVEKINSQSQSEFYTVELGNNGLDAFISQPIKILALSEFGLKLKSERKVIPGEVLELTGLSPELLSKDRLLVRCLSVLESQDKTFIIQSTFIGISEAQRQTIRLNCRKIAIESKRSVA